YTLSEVELAKVQISSNPTGAKIYINGLEKGETNKGLFLFPGNYDVRLIKSGYLDKEEKIAVNTNKQNNFLYNLEKNAGTLNISVSPSSAVVLINKEKTTNRNIQLSPGKYKIEISENGYYDQSETIEVELGKTISKSFNLEPKVGKLQLSVSPPEAEVTLRKDGKIIKNWQGLELLKDLQVGEYEITVKNSGYETVNKRIEIIENQTTIYDTVLERTNLYRSNKNSNTSNVTKSVPEGMVFVEGGEFLMGSNDGDDDEKPVHKVKVNSFYIGKFEVTDLLYWSIMDPDAKYFDRYHAKCCISWDGAQKFINKFNEVTGKKYRLPTEAEWEYAARGGNKSKGFVFAGGNKIDLVGRYPGNKERTDKVGQFKPNELGIYDMSGNVWEWCQDWYSENYYYERTYDNPKGPESGEYKVLRGGSYLGGLTKINGEYSGNKLKVHDRDYDDPEDDDNNYGFRLVLDIE
nr:SUMF1/EgtB/PvdO family nonheme iron enzyme [Melioribacteraceae bacterium]